MSMPERLRRRSWQTVAQARLDEPPQHTSITAPTGGHCIARPSHCGTARLAAARLQPALARPGPADVTGHVPAEQRPGLGRSDGRTRPSDPLHCTSLTRGRPGHAAGGARFGDGSTVRFGEGPSRVSPHVLHAPHRARRAHGRRPDPGPSSRRPAAVAGDAGRGPRGRARAARDLRSPPRGVDVAAAGSRSSTPRETGSCASRTRADGRRGAHTGRPRAGPRALRLLRRAALLRPRPGRRGSWTGSGPAGSSGTRTRPRPGLGHAVPLAAVEPRLRGVLRQPERRRARRGPLGQRGAHRLRRPSRRALLAIS